jgi:acyl-ACP thioesterase
MRLDALARWLQDVAFIDIEEAGVADVAIWVLRRTRIKVHRFPRFGERCDVLTFCSGFGRMWAERRTSIVPAGGGEALVEADALWVHLDPDTRRPSPLTEPELAVYSEAIDGHRVNARLRHPTPDGAPEHVRDWRFHAIDCDVAAHVNNTAYWRPLEEELIAGGPGLTACLDLEGSGRNEPTSIDAEIEFRSGAQPGQFRYLATGPYRWLTGAADGELYASTVLMNAQTTSGSN